MVHKLYGPICFHYDITPPRCYLLQVWCSLFTPQSISVSTKTDPHSPGPYRWDWVCLCLYACVVLKCVLIMEESSF